MKKLKELIQQRPVHALGIVACIIGLFICSSVQSCITNAARESAVALKQSRVPGIEKRFKDFTDHVKQAQGTHSAEYLKTVSTTAVGQEFDAAKKTVDEALKLSSASAIRTKVADATTHLNAVSAEVKKQETYLTTLDTAKREYKTRLSAAQDAVTSTQTLVGSLVDIGFAERHFANAQQQLATAQSGLDQLQRSNGDNQYLTIWENAKGLEDTAQQIKEKVRAVPALRDENIRQIAAVRQAAANASVTLQGAQDAVSNLRSYSQYQTEFANASYDPSSIGATLETAEKLNGMELQDFQGAALRIKTARDSIASLTATAQKATQQWATLQLAKKNLQGKKGEVQAAISRAQNQISSFSWNNQGNAIQLVANAQSALANAQQLENSDPIASITQYGNASNNAINAYNAVNTRSREDDTTIVVIDHTNDDYYYNDRERGYTGGTTRTYERSTNSGTVRDSGNSRPTVSVSRPPPAPVPSTTYKQNAPGSGTFKTNAPTSGTFKGSSPGGGTYKAPSPPPPSRPSSSSSSGGSRSSGGRR